jgi:hypothetical protein
MIVFFSSEFYSGIGYQLSPLSSGRIFVVGIDFTRSNYCENLEMERNEEK